MGELNERTYHLRAEVVRRILDQENLSINELARRVEVDAKTIRGWLKGKPAFPRNLTALAQVLMVDAQDLVAELQPTYLHPNARIDANFDCANPEEFLFLCQLLSEVKDKFDRFKRAQRQAIIEGMGDASYSEFKINLTLAMRARLFWNRRTTLLKLYCTNKIRNYARRALSSYRCLRLKLARSKLVLSGTTKNSSALIYSEMATRRPTTHFLMLAITVQESAPWEAINSSRPSPRLKAVISLNRNEVPPKTVAFKFFLFSYNARKLAIEELLRFGKSCEAICVLYGNGKPTDDYWDYMESNYGVRKYN